MRHARLVVDLETHKAEGKEGQRPDFRADIVDRVGWLEDGAETAKWARCFCSLKFAPKIYLMHNAMYDLGLIAGQTEMAPGLKAGFLRSVILDDTLALAYCQGEEDLSLKGLMQKYLGVNTDTYPYARIGE